MPDLELNDFELGSEILSHPERRILDATSRESGDSVRITIFSPAISLRPEFRRAVKTDRAMLSMLQHQSIIRYLGYGESSESVFLCTAACGFQSLSEHLARKRRFSSEDVVEIGWQICSALQQSHNLGLAHGGLSADCVLLSENLQVMVTDFGVARWLRAAQESSHASSSGPALITITALASREDIQTDLTDLARVLSKILETCCDTEEPESGKATMNALVQRLLDRIATPSSSAASQRPVSAREFQGRLGEILIGTGDDSMSLVDQRKIAASSRRSIVMELFEPPYSTHDADGSPRQPATFAWRSQFLPIALIVTAAVILLLLAGYFL